MGLGKVRTKFGEFIDLHKVKQMDIVHITGLNRNTVASACNDVECVLNRSTQILLMAAVRDLTGEDVKREDFW